VRQPLDQVFSDHRRVPARAAGGKDNPVDAAEPAGGHVQPAELGRGLGTAQPPTARVEHRVGLFADLLEHVVGMASELDRVGLPVDPVDPRCDRTVLAVADLEIAGSEADDLSVLQVGHTGRVGNDRHRIAGQQVLVVPHADHQGAAEPRADDLARTRQADHAQAVRSLEPGQDLLHGLEWLAGPFQLAGDQVRDDLGIGLAIEDETLRGEFPPQHRMVFDHPIVHDRDSMTIAAAAQVGVGIGISGRSMRGPARMADSALTCQGLLLEHLFQDPHPAGALPHLEPPILDRG